LSLFWSEESLSEDIANIVYSLKRIRKHINHHLVDKVALHKEFAVIAKNFWDLISMIYQLKWDLLIYNKEKQLMINKGILRQFVNKSNNDLDKDKISIKPTEKKSQSEPTPTPLPKAVHSAPTVFVPPPLNKKVETITKKALILSNVKKSYTQASKANILLNIDDILHIKEAFLSLSADEVGKMIKAKNSSEGQKKPRINMMMRGPSRKQVIIPMAKLNAELIINSANLHIANINKCQKNTKSDIIADFICITNEGVVITINKPVNTSNLSTIEKYIKNISNINSDSINSPCLPKSKLYLKIVGLSHKIENSLITSDFVKSVIKESHFFKDIILASKPCIIKASSKSDMAVVWIDIWDSQSSSVAKDIINH